jgi:hypothetical protein
MKKTREKVDQVKKHVETVIHLHNIAGTKDRVALIAYPDPNITNSAENPDPKLCEILIDYGMIVGHIKHIENSTDPIWSLARLSRFPDLHEPYARLSRFMWQNPGEPNDSATHRLLMELHHSAHAWILFRLLSLNQEYLIDRRKIAQEFNQFLQRNEALPDDIAWAHRLNPDLPPTFLLEIPHFSPNDLFYLIIRQTDNGMHSGFLFRDIEKLNLKVSFLADMSHASSESYSSFSEAVGQIARIALKNYCNEYAEHPLINGFEEAMKRRQADRPTIMESKIYPWILSLYVISRGLDADIESVFQMDDLFFLEPDWLSNNELCSRLPSFVFWLIQNQDCHRQVQYYLRSIIDSNSLPLQLHFLRIFSSYRCIAFQRPSANDVSQKLQRGVIGKLKNGSPSLKWVNLLLDNVPLDVFDEDIHLFYRFLRSIDESPVRIRDDPITEIVKSSLTDFVMGLIDHVFENKVNDLPAQDIMSSGFLRFLVNPSNAILVRLGEFLCTKQKEVIDALKANELELVAKLGLLKEASCSLKKTDADLADCQFVLKKDELTKRIARAQELQINFEQSFRTYRV